MIESLDMVEGVEVCEYGHVWSIEKYIINNTFEKVIVHDLNLFVGD